MKIETQEPLSDQLRRIMEQSPITRYQLSSLADIDPAVLCRFIKGKRGLGSKSWDALGKALNLRLVVDETGTKEGSD